MPLAFTMSLLPEQRYRRRGRNFAGAAARSAFSGRY